MEEKMTGPKGRVEQWVYKCCACERTFGSCQGLAGHMNAHRLDDGFKKGSSHLRVPYEPTAAESFGFAGVGPQLLPYLSIQSPFRLPGNGPWHAAAVQPGFGGLVHSPSTGRLPGILPPSVNQNRRFPSIFPESESSSERTLTDPKAKVAAKGGEDEEEEEEVTSKERIEVDTELKLGC